MPPAEPNGGAGPKAGAAIIATGLEKTFRLPRHSQQTLKGRIIHPRGARRYDELHALRDVSMRVEAGEAVGIIGRNGSGKSTLLKLLAGIYRPDSGTVSVRGRVSPFIELGVGFNMELPALDNVILNFSLFGLSRQEALRRFDSIIEFAGLEEFTELKLRNYSSGMQVRLAFSTAIQVDAEILLLDEVIAVGDAAFQERCFDVFASMREEGRTIVLVTHDLEAVARFCDRAFLLERGHLVAEGEPLNVIDSYRRRVPGFEGDHLVEAIAGPGRLGDGSAEVTDAWFEDAEGNRTEEVSHRERFAACFDVVFHERCPTPTLGILMRDQGGRSAFSANTTWAGIDTGTKERGEQARFRVEIDNMLTTGRYFLTAGIQLAGGDVADMRESAAALEITGGVPTGAVADLDHRVTVERLSAAAEAAKR